MWARVALAAAVCCGWGFETTAESTDRRPLLSWTKTLAMAGLFFAVLLFVDRSQDFIYFRF